MSRQSLPGWQCKRHPPDTVATRLRSNAVGLHSYLIWPPSFQRSRTRLPRSGPLIASPSTRACPSPASSAGQSRAHGLAGGPALWVMLTLRLCHGPCVPDGGTARAKAPLIRCSAEAASPRRSPHVDFPSPKLAGKSTSRLLCDKRSTPQRATRIRRHSGCAGGAPLLAPPPGRTLLRSAAAGQPFTANPQRARREGSRGHGEAPSPLTRPNGRRSTAGYARTVYRRPFVLDTLPPHFAGLRSMV